jgi:hypothetical protein
MSRIVNGPGGNCYKHRITEQKFLPKPSDRRRMFDAIGEELSAQRWPDCVYQLYWDEMGEDDETEEEMTARITEVIEFFRTIEKKD